MKEYLITNGVDYVVRDISPNKYKTTKCSSLADRFTRKQGKSIVRNYLPKRMKGYYLEDYNTREKIDVWNNSDRKKDIRVLEFDESIIRDITFEAEKLKELNPFNKDDLIEKERVLNEALSYADSAISDIRHIIKERRPPANKMAQIYGILNDYENKRSQIKMAQSYVDVMITAYDEKWTLEKINISINKITYEPYKPRTHVYDMIENLIENKAIHAIAG